LKLKCGFFTKIEEKGRSKIGINEFTANSFLSGYWQDETYFKNIRNVLLEEIQIRAELKSQVFNYFENKIKNTNAVSIHLRRGDFLETKNKNIFLILEKEYYKRAIELVKSRISKPQFFIFSDEIDWAKSNMGFLNDPIYVVDRSGELKDYEELILMSHCKHNIIANSTFSWWAAWLNQNFSKMVIQPKSAFSDAILERRYQDKNLLYSENFIRI
jgi:hypothetical protein